MLTIYQASAGSGKTFNLAYEYIKLLLGRKTEQGRYLLRNQGRFHHRAILAITFTNKATDEMKRRIVRELALLSRAPLTDGEKSKYEPMLLDEFGCTSDDLADASRKALVELLNDFTFFNVSTIDAFFQTVLRTFAREAELSGNFEVELSDTYAISTAVDTLLASVRGSATAVQSSKSRVQNNSALRTPHSALRTLNSALYDSEAVIQGWIVRFMLSEMRAGRAFNLFNRTSRIHEAIIGFITRLSNETLKRRYDEMADYLADPARVVRLDEALDARLDALDRRRRDACHALVTALAAKGLLDKYLKAHVLNPLRRYADGSRPDRLSATLRKAIDDPAGQSYLKGTAPDPALHALLCDALSAVADAAAGEPTLRATRANLFALGILGSVFSIMSQFRADNNLILLSDTNGLLSDIISTDETPFIYERLGMQLRHFLIDEFQDTSRLQWDNLAPLLAESLSHDHDNLIIGDPKQSIYRFRNASPELLRSEVARRFPREAVTLSSDTNWRSARGIVEFNNGLFRALAANLGVDDIYTTVAQRVSPPHAGRPGDVRLVPLEADTAADFTPLALDATVAEIGRLLSLGASPGDIVLLTRTNPEARAVIDYLRHALPELPILSDEALLVSAAPSVRLLLSLLRAQSTSTVQSSKGTIQSDTPAAGAPYIAPAATNPTTAPPTIDRFINAYHYHIFHGHTPADAIRLSAVGSRPVATATNAEESLTPLKTLTTLKTLPPSTPRALNTDPVSLAERLIATNIPLADRRRDAPFIAAFLDLIIDYSARFGASVPGFLRWWDTTGHTAAIPAPESVDAVRVMTIHKSKGLEFPSVIIPFATWPLVRDGELRWYDSHPIPGIPDELLPPIIPITSSAALADTPYAGEYAACRLDETTDQLNATYVAFTRAGTTLTVIYRPDAPGTIGAAIHQALPAVHSSTFTVQNATPAPPLNPLTTLTPLSSRKVAAGAMYSAPTGLNSALDAIHPDTPFWGSLRIDQLPDLDTPRSRGIVIHDILAHVATPDTLPCAVARVAHRLNLPDDRVAPLHDTLAHLIAHPRVAPWFAPDARILRERAINLPDGTRYRPDRVVINPDGTATVIDYKTGSPLPAHRAQVRRYARHLAAILRRPVTPAILYTDPLRLSILRPLE